jgi:hypothetical protein
MKDDLRDLPLMKAPDSVWASIEASLDAKTKAKPVSRLTWTLGIAAAGAVVLATGAWWATRPPKPAWQVERVDGKLTEHGKIQVGDWLQTDGSSRARISVGDIGTIDVAPNTRVRMVASQPGEQRLRLARGEISASVTAPPRLFLGETPASTAVELGCAYTMKADEDGSGFLHVTLGWVSLEWAGRESLVPAGASCRSRAKIGPGTPYFDDASQALQDALVAFDFGDGGESAASASLDTVLAAIAATNSTARQFERDSMAPPPVWLGQPPLKSVLANWLGPCRLVALMAILATLVVVAGWKPAAEPFMPIWLVPAYIMFAGAAWCAFGVAVGMRFTRRKALLWLAAAYALVLIGAPIAAMPFQGSGQSQVLMAASPFVAVSMLTMHTSVGARPVFDLRHGALAATALHAAATAILLTVAVLVLERRGARNPTTAVPGPAPVSVRVS